MNFRYEYQCSWKQKSKKSPPLFLLRITRKKSKLVNASVYSFETLYTKVESIHFYIFLRKVMFLHNLFKMGIFHDTGDIRRAIEGTLVRVYKVSKSEHNSTPRILHSYENRWKLTQLKIVYHNTRVESLTSILAL